MISKAKRKYFAKIYKNAQWIFCSCGCNVRIKNKDNYGRNKKYINGHNKRKYKDKLQHKREWNHKNRKKRYLYKTRYQKQRKQKLISLLGNQCQECGLKYTGKNACLFQFHHKIKSKTNFHLTLSTMGKAWKRLLKEVKKCKLLCANCHFLKHGSEY